MGARVETRGLEGLEERLMVHFSQLEPLGEAPRSWHKAPVRAPSLRREPARKLTLWGLVVRPARDEEARTAEPGEGLRRTEGGRWESGRLLVALEA